MKASELKKVIEEHIGINEIARQNDMDDHVVRNWLKNYQEYSEYLSELGFPDSYIPYLYPFTFILYI